MNWKNFFAAVAGGAIISGAAAAAVINEGDRILVAYYSLSGNTRAVAEQIKRETGADVAVIETAEAYPSAYKELTERAKREIADGYKPELKNKPDSIAAYDVVFVGSPCWWGTVAPAVASFLSAYDFSGKTVIPFMTHGGSGLGHAEADIKTMLPAARVEKGHAFWGRNARNAGEEVKDWIKELKNE